MWIATDLRGHQIDKLCHTCKLHILSCNTADNVTHPERNCMRCKCFSCASWLLVLTARGTAGAAFLALPLFGLPVVSAALGIYEPLAGLLQAAAFAPLLLPS